MPTQAMIVFTSTEVAAALVLNETTDFKVAPRVIDNILAENLNDPVVIVGNSVASAAILNDPEYIPVWSASLGSLPIRVLDSDVLFLPPEG